MVAPLTVIVALSALPSLMKEVTVMSTVPLLIVAPA